MKVFENPLIEFPKTFQSERPTSGLQESQERFKSFGLDVKKIKEM